MAKALNPFLRLYSLARREHYAPDNWKELLVGVYRKADSKRSIKELCLLFYALSRASRHGALKSLRITCRKDDSNPQTVTIGLDDVIDAYQCHVHSFIKYMNSSQLAMLARSLGMLNRLDNSACSSILNRIACHKLQAQPRSLCSLVLTLVQSDIVGRDVIEVLLLERMDVLRQINKQDLLDLCRSVELSKISNDTILDLIYMKLNDYSGTLSPSELLSTLTWLCTRERVDMKLLDRLRHIMRVQICKYDLRDLCVVTKAIVKLKPSYCREFLVLFINPIVQQKIGMHDIGVATDALLQYYLAISQACCDVSLRPLLSVMDNLHDPEHWTMFFKILQGYQSHTGSLPKCYVEPPPTEVTMPNFKLTTLEELERCWERGLAIFLTWFESDVRGITRIAVITEILVNCGRCSSSFADKLLTIILDVHPVCSPDALVNVAYNLHAVHGFKCGRLIEAILENPYDHKLGSCLKVLGIQFTMDMDRAESLICRLRSWACESNPNYHNQTTDWMMPAAPVPNGTRFHERTRNMTVNPATQEVLCYCLASMVLRQNGRPECDDYGILPNDTSVTPHIVSDYRVEILHLVRRLNPDCRWLQRILLCMAILDKSLFEEARNQHTPPVQVPPDLYLTQIFSDVRWEGHDMRKLMIRSYDLSSVVSTLITNTEQFAFLDMGHVSSRWDRVWMDLLKLRFQATGHRVVQFAGSLDKVLEDMDLFKSH